jgi:hypothetical protein
MTNDLPTFFLGLMSDEASVDYTDICFLLAAYNLKTSIDKLPLYGRGFGEIQLASQSIE